MGKRPDYAVTVYCNLIRRTYRRKPIIIGGIEASLRRLAHYDYWSDKRKRSILLDSQADLLIYGMGERAVVQIADALNDGMDVQDITYIDGTVYKTRAVDDSVPSIVLPSYPEIQKNARAYAESFAVQYRNTDPFCAKRLIEPYSGHEFVVQNPPQKPLSQKEMDHVYGLPYCRTYHPSYKKLGGIPAIREIEFSLTSCRGCFGACSFCALTFHQGRIIQTRSHASILQEAEAMTHAPGFKGYIHDVGGPTANFRQPACKKAAAARRMPGAAVPVPRAVQESHRRPLGLSGAAAQAPQAAERQKGLHSQRHPLRLPAGRSLRHVFQGARALPHLRPAEGRAGACVRPGAARHGQAPAQRLPAVRGKIQKRSTSRRA